MKETFELEWMGGPAERYFRKIRPGIDELPWETLTRDARDFPPSLIAAGRGLWTDLAINEYRAVASFAEVTRALVEAKAPLDMVGMAGNFLADETTHVELASRMAMELGGAVERQIDLTRFAARRDPRLTAFQQANELVLRVCCISEAYASGTALGTYRAAAHPLTKAVYEWILRDEAHHHRLGALYFEWASERLDDAERARLSTTLAETLRALSMLWKRRVSKVTDGATEEGWRVDDIHVVGWLESASMAPLAREVVARDVLEPLAKLGIVLDEAVRDELLA